MLEFPMHSNNSPCDILTVDHMNRLLLAQLLLRLGYPIKPVLYLSLSSPQSRQIERASTERHQLVLGYGTRVCHVVLGVSRDPCGLTWNRPDTGATELDPLVGLVLWTVVLRVGIYEALAFVRTAQGEGDENCLGRRESCVLLWIAWF